VGGYGEVFFRFADISGLGADSDYEFFKGLAYLFVVTAIVVIAHHRTIV